MRQNLPDGYEPYDNRTIKAKLFDKFENDVIVSTLNGRADVITFRTTASKILQNFHDKQLHLNENDENDLIIKTAAQLLKNEIKAKHTSKQFYPSPKSIEDIQSDQTLGYIPKSLQTLLSNIFAGKTNDLKVAAIG